MFTRQFNHVSRQNVRSMRGADQAAGEIAIKRAVDLAIRAKTLKLRIGTWILHWNSGRNAFVCLHDAFKTTPKLQ